MKHTLIATALALNALMFGSSAYAWTLEDCIEDKFKHPDCAKYPKPTPHTPSAPPSNVTANGGDADAIAKSLSSALAQGGQGGDADASARNVNNIMTSLASNPTLHAEVMSRLTAEQRQKLVNYSPSSAVGGGGVGTGGGATVQSNTSVRNITLTGMTANAPSLPYQSGQFTVVDGECGPVRTYDVFKINVVHPRFFGDREDKVDTGLLTETRTVGADGRVVRPEWEVLGENEAGKWRIVQGEIPRQLAGHISIAGTNGVAIQIGGTSGAGGASTSGGGANQFMAAYYLSPKTCYMKQVKVGNGWVPESLIKVEVDKTATAPTEPDVSHREILAAILRLEAQVNIPVTRLRETSRKCDLMEFKDPKTGKTFMACPGSRSGTYTHKEEVADTATARLGAGAKTGAEKK